jgi:uncharacterized protein YndB with AHSA1/START domain
MVIRFDQGPAERAVRHAIEAPAPIEAVWEAWTTDAGLRTWAVEDSKVELAVGGAYEWYFLPRGSPGGRGSEGCRIIGFQAPTMLSFTWNAPPHLKEARAQRSVTILRLAPLGPSLTALGLTAMGWGDGGEWDEAFEYFDAAWGRVLAGLQTRFTQAADAPSGSGT